MHSRKSSTHELALLGLVMALSGFASGDEQGAAQQPRPIIEEHAQIEGPFADGPDVTDTCLDCHEQAAHDVMQTSHWTWSVNQEVYGRGSIAAGKRHAINNFCYGVASNLSKCTECHIGYGWKDDAFDFDDPSRIDCLVCHDTTGTYKRIGGDGGMADPATDFEFVARNVGSPGRANCGACHFYGGGAHAVKHGDLEKLLIDADAAIDVHMASDGLNFRCQQCHKTERHEIPGRSMAVSPGGTNAVACTDCHQGKPLHKHALLDQHALSVACQTCHIPIFAKGEATKTYWDWSAAGTKPESEVRDDGKPLYVPVKGRFRWERNIVPAYRWFNGKTGVHRWGEDIPQGDELVLNWPVGDRSDPEAKIYPFKLNRGRQIFDKVHRYLINPHLVGDDGFVYTLDWDTASRLGMQARGLDYSGQYGFIDSLMYIRINHMVAPADNALGCRDCHGPTQKRLPWKELGYDADPLYVPGQARFPLNR